MEDFFRKPMADMSVNTQPIIFGDSKPRMQSVLIQTQPLVDESGLLDEPEGAPMGHEPTTAQINHETGSNSSWLDPPQPDQVIEVPQIPKSSNSEEEYYVDDWMESEVYKYAFEMHYDKMVKRKLISVELVKRPEVPKELQKLSLAQRYEHNLNPNGLDILSQIECEYGQAALRKKSATYCNEEMLEDLYVRAKTTIQVLVANMVRPVICNAVLFAHY